MRTTDLDLPVEVLPNFAEWSKVNPSGFTSWSYIRNEIPAETVAVLAKLFYPEFVEVEGTVFLSEMFRMATYEAWKEKGVARLEVQRVMNHIHLDDFFADEGPLAHELVSYLGATLRKAWSAALLNEYPQRRFLVEFTCEGDAKESHGHTVSFCESIEAV